MADYRELGIVEMEDRLKAAKVALGLVTLRRAPNKGIKKEDSPAVFISEGLDQITKTNGRDPRGFPARRELEVTFDVIVHEDHTVAIRPLWKQVRNVIFSDIVVADEDTIIQELRANGPYGYSMPGMHGMQLIIGLYYIDYGN